MQSFSMRGQERVHHVNFLQPHQRGVQHFSLPEYSENSGKCISITLSTHVETVVLLSKGAKGPVDLCSARTEVERRLVDSRKVNVDFSLENFNLPKSENARQPQCTPEKEEAIMQAFRHFGIV